MGSTLFSGANKKRSLALTVNMKELHGSNKAASSNSRAVYVQVGSRKDEGTPSNCTERVFQNKIYGCDYCSSKEHELLIDCPLFKTKTENQCLKHY